VTFDTLELYLTFIEDIAWQNMGNSRRQIAMVSLMVYFVIGDSEVVAKECNEYRRL
jgi:hypothetical protein